MLTDVQDSFLGTPLVPLTVLSDGIDPISKRGLASDTEERRGRGGARLFFVPRSRTFVALARGWILLTRGETQGVNAVTQRCSPQRTTVRMTIIRMNLCWTCDEGSDRKRCTEHQESQPRQSRSDKRSARTKARERPEAVANQRCLNPPKAPQKRARLLPPRERLSAGATAEMPSAKVARGREHRIVSSSPSMQHFASREWGASVFDHPEGAGDFSEAPPAPRSDAVEEPMSHSRAPATRVPLSLARTFCDPLALDCAESNGLSGQANRCGSALPGMFRVSGARTSRTI